MKGRFGAEDWAALAFYGLLLLALICAACAELQR